MKSPKLPGPATVTTSGERELRIERIFNAPRERVWQAMTEPSLVARWWGRGNELAVERLEVERGGHWRFVEHAAEGAQGFEGRFREVVPPERLVQTFEWDPMPGHVVINTMTLEDVGDGRTRLVNVSQFYTRDERDGMLDSGMERGMNQSYEALDRLLEKLADGSVRVEERDPSLAVEKVAFTAYPVSDVARAREFYEETLGLRVGMAGNQGDMHWIEYDLPGGGCLAITNTMGNEPSRSAGGTVALEVADLTRLIEHLESKNVTLEGDVIRGPRCRMAVCLDSEGNSIVLHQLDRTDAS